MLVELKEQSAVFRIGILVCKIQAIIPLSQVDSDL